MKTYDVIMTPSDDGRWVLKSEADKELRHQKHRRCRAISRWCACKSIYWIDEDPDKSDFYYKWEFRWEKIAMQFKEAK